MVGEGERGREVNNLLLNAGLLHHTLILQGPNVTGRRLVFLFGWWKQLASSKNVLPVLID